MQPVCLLITCELLTVLLTGYQQVFCVFVDKRLALGLFGCCFRWSGVLGGLCYFCGIEYAEKVS